MSPLSIPEYTTLFSQCFSPDGKHLAIGDDRGRVAIFILDQIALNSRNKLSDADDNTEAKSKVKVVQHRFQAVEPASPVLSLISTEHELLVGSVGTVTGWTWKSILKKAPKSAWSIDLPLQPNAAIKTDANYLALNSTPGTAGQLIVGGGDNNVHVYDLETRNSLHVLRGHDSFVHSISLCPTTQLIASGSEDGSVKVWDVRKKAANTATFKPAEKPSLERPRLGKWVGAVSISSDWIACGGGPRAALWHLRTLSPSDPLPPFDAAIHEMKIVGDNIFIGGESKTMYRTNITGEVTAEIPLSSACLYSIVCQDSPVKILSCVGSSSKIDICSPSFSYKDQIINFPLY